MNIVEKIDYLIEAKNVNLYHGTCADSASILIKSGWKPRSGFSGGNVGQPNYLYLTNMKENARWFAEEKGCSTVLLVKNVPLSFLKVDPEDGIADTVEQELNNKFGLPGYVVSTKHIKARNFKIVEK